MDYFVFEKGLCWIANSVLNRGNKIRFVLIFYPNTWFAFSVQDKNLLQANADFRFFQIESGMLI